MADFNMDLPSIAAGTVTLTNGSAVVTASGNGNAWRAPDGSDTRAAVGRGSWLVVPSRSLLAMIRSIDSPTQITLMLPFAGATGSALAYEILPPGDNNVALISENLRALARRLETTNPEDDINFEFGGRRHRLVAQADGTFVVRSGPSATDWSALPVTARLSGPDPQYMPAGALADSSLRLGLRGHANSFLEGSISDLNTALQPGFYRTLRGTDGATNTPDGAGGGNYWQLEVMAHTNDWVTQIATSMVGSATSGHEMWRRSRQNGTWGGWYRLFVAVWEVPSRPASGRWVALAPGTNANAVLPAGGTWVYQLTAFTSSGTYTASLAGIFAGGTIVGGAFTGQWVGFAWRIE